MADDPGSTVLPKITYDYIKSNHFRVIHADGAVGGATPQGLISFTLYSERPPIPVRVVHPLERTENGVKLGDEIVAERVGRSAIVREAEVGVMMSVDNATALRDWLTMRIDMVRKAQGKTE